MIGYGQSKTSQNCLLFFLLTSGLNYKKKYDDIVLQYTVQVLNARSGVFGEVGKNYY